MNRFIAPLALALAIVAQSALGANVTVTMYEVDERGTGNIVGLIVFRDSDNGLRVDPNLRGLPEGQHGTHVHQNPNCGPAEKDGKMVPGLGAGGHYDPRQTGKHEGPMGNGHLGDLPVLYVDGNGNATRTMRAPRLTVSDIAGRAIIIHAGGDNYSDVPKPLGGGGSRIACGIVVE